MNVADLIAELISQCHAVGRDPRHVDVDVLIPADYDDDGVAREGTVTGVFPGYGTGLLIEIVPKRKVGLAPARAFQAGGQPLLLCAGWAARRLAHIQRPNLEGDRP